MNRLRLNFLLLLILFTTFVNCAASLKRGLSWEEGKINLNEHHASLLLPGVAWVYNWGPSPANAGVYSQDFYFVPMAWNGNYNTTAIRNWLTNHPETKYLLGFNEPNFADQASMTPSQAVASWPKLEEIAEEFNVKLVAPALNFSGSMVGGKIWGIYEWYDEFFRLYPGARVDCLALHCYMNWHSAMSWFVSEYIYKDLFTPSNENYGKFPHLVKFLEDFKEANGHFPKMMLTEFCAWEYDYLPDVYFQIDQMTQKVQFLEKNDLVEGYAWFIGNASGGAAAFPYMSIFQNFSATSQLSELGKIYVNMSDFDTSLYHRPDEIIAAKDYIDATTDDHQIKLRINSEFSSTSSLPLQIEIPSGGSVLYQIETPADGNHVFILHVKNSGGSAFQVSLDNRFINPVSIPGSGGEWTDITFHTEITKGKHTVKFYNLGNSVIYMNSFSFSNTSGVESIRADKTTDEIKEIFNLDGISLGKPDFNQLQPGIYLMKHSSGKVTKIHL